MTAEALRDEELTWALSAGSRSGRVAKQFIDDLSGRPRMRPSSTGSAIS